MALEEEVRRQALLKIEGRIRELSGKLQRISDRETARLIREDGGEKVLMYVFDASAIVNLIKKDSVSLASKGLTLDLAIYKCLSAIWKDLLRSKLHL